MNRIFYVIGVVVVAVRHAVLHFEVRRGEFVPLIKLSPVCRDSLFQRGVHTCAMTQVVGTDVEKCADIRVVQ